MSMKLNPAETALVVDALRHKADTLATTMEEALKEIGGAQAEKKSPAMYRILMSSMNTGANDLRDLAQRIADYKPNAPGRKPGSKVNPNGTITPPPVKTPAAG